MSQQPTHSEAIEKINELIKGKTIAMLTSVCEGDHLHARPMAVLDVDFRRQRLVFHPQRRAQS